MGWALTSLWVALVVAVVAGAALALCKRYCVGWQWSTRNVWSICEEWRQRLSWLWAPREEKVGLVKSQHPLGQTIPGLYRQTGNASHLLHSDSDLRLDAQGGFTRFEPVDRDLHPPLGPTGNIPPQPLRPAPQPGTTARSRPPPLRTPSAADYLRMHEAGPGPLTPPPSLQRPTEPSGGLSAFVFQTESSKHYGLPKSSGDHHSPFRFESEASKAIQENIQMNPYGEQNHVDTRLRYEQSFDPRCNPYRPFESDVESTRIRYEVHGAPMANLDGKNDDGGCNTSYGSYDIVQRSNTMRQHVRNDSRGTPANSLNAASQTIMESIYGPEAVSKILQSTQSLGDDLDEKGEQAQSIEMTPFRSSSVQNDIDSSYLFGDSQDFQRVSQYIQSLPDLPDYSSMCEFSIHQDPMYSEGIQDTRSGMKYGGESASSPVPPPPAPPDPPQETPKKNGLTTGERIFNTLRSVTLRGYIDASEFYNSVIAPIQQNQFNFPSSNQLQDEVQGMYGENDSDVIGPDDSRRRSDLYNRELNLKAHRTAQEVYNSLQDPPSSPLLLKDHVPDKYSFMSDPSFTRTSEEIYQSLGQRRNSMERVNGFNEFNELDDPHSLLNRGCQDYSGEEELIRRLSEDLEEDNDSYLLNEYNEISSGSRRRSQEPDPEPPPNELSMKKTISCHSVCCDTSALDEILKEHDIETCDVGLISVGIEPERCRGVDTVGSLAISVLEATDLITSDGQDAKDTFVRICLLPDSDIHQRTRIYRGSPSPSYQEKLWLPLRSSPTGRILLVEVFSDETSIDGGISLIGEARLQLGLKTQATTWLKLKGPVVPTAQLGELLFSLMYSKTSGKLTLVVVKARNLRGSSTANSELFVEVYLLQQGKKTHQAKIPVKKGEKSPIFNVSIIFNVPAHILQAVQLGLTVLELNSDQGISAKPYHIGHVIVGPTSTGKALEHWRRMLCTPKHPVAAWHYLRKRKPQDRIYYATTM